MKQETRWLGDRMIVGELPTDWEFQPMNFPQATPGSVFKARIRRVCKWGQMQVSNTYVEIKDGLWAELEMWYHDQEEQIAAGKVWRKCVNNNGLVFKLARI